MSWATFKSNILRRADSPENIDSIEFVANLWATEYDKAIKLGRDNINLISVQNGNVSLMESLFKVALLQGQSSPSSTFSLITEFGKGVQAYWTGATMNQFPIPLIPAPGSIQNIVVNSNLVTSPGVWTPQPPLSPNNNTALIVDQFISAATLHLTTVSGIIQTTSLYPSVPTPIPSPGVIVWTGYNVPPSAPSIAVPAAAAAALAKLDEAPSTTLSQEQLEAAAAEKLEAEAMLEDGSLTYAEKETAEDYVALKQDEIVSGEKSAADIDLTEEEVDGLTEISDSKCEIGLTVVNIAKKDIGIVETGTPPGKNYGGFPGGQRFNRPGRIDAMLKNCGLNNQAKVQKDGSGYYWCAAAVTTWWKEAGLPTPPGAAGCQNWVNWAKKNGYWSAKPVVGAAVLYGTTAHAHHIGVVSSVLPDGRITTIEGNTSGGGFDRNGCGCFSKSPKKGIVGYVIPPGCI